MALQQSSFRRRAWLREITTGGISEFCRKATLAIALSTARIDESTVYLDNDFVRSISRDAGLPTH
jgi:hypothetical protein